MKNNKKAFQTLIFLLSFFSCIKFVKAEEFELCEQSGVLKTFNIVGYVILVIKILVPVLLIVTGMITIFKAYTSNDDDLGVPIKKLITKCLISIAIFFIPTIVSALMGLVSEYSDTVKKFEGCNLCLNSPGSSKCLDTIEMYYQAELDENEKNSYANTHTQNEKKTYDHSSANFTGSDSEMINAMMSWAVNIANDNSIGYSQSTRYGNPNYDCSSFVWYALASTGKWSTSQLGGSAFTTYGMDNILFPLGFAKYKYSGAGDLQVGDILWTEHHTEIYYGNNQEIGAHGRNGIAQADQVSVRTHRTSYTHYYRYIGS